MSKIYIFNDSGTVIQEMPDTESYRKQAEDLVMDWNIVNKRTPKKGWVSGDKFPPTGTVWDSSIPGVRVKTLQERVDTGEIQLNPYEKIKDGMIVAKSVDELITDGVKTLDQVRNEALLKLNLEVEDYMRLAKTPAGRPLSMWSLLRVVATFGERHVPDDDPEKAAYISSGLLYNQAGLADLLAGAQTILNAYSSAEQVVLTSGSYEDIKERGTLSYWL